MTSTRSAELVLELILQVLEGQASASVLQDLLTELQNQNRVFRPDGFVFEYFTRVSGPQAASTLDIDMNTDSDAVVSVFEYEVPTQMNFNLSRVNFSIVDGAMRYGQFGGLGGALSNGIALQIINTDDSVAIDFTQGQNIKTNEDFANLAGVDSIAAAAAGDDFLPVRWTISKAGAPMRLNGGEKFRITIQDDISNLSFFRTMIQGVIWSNA